MRHSEAERERNEDRMGKKEIADGKKVKYETRNRKSEEVRWSAFYRWIEILWFKRNNIYC